MFTVNSETLVIVGRRCFIAAYLTRRLLMIIRHKSIVEFVLSDLLLRPILCFFYMLRGLVTVFFYQGNKLLLNFMTAEFCNKDIDSCFTF